MKICSKKDYKSLALVHTALPENASAVSFPDVMEWALRIMIGLRPEVLDPRHNEGLKLIVSPWGTGRKAKPPVVDAATGQKKRLADVTTGNLNSWLKAKASLPPRAVPDKWLTTYSMRRTFACYLYEFGITYLEAKKWFGHSADSVVMERVYAQSPGRVYITAAELPKDHLRARIKILKRGKTLKDFKSVLAEVQAKRAAKRAAKKAAKKAAKEIQAKE
jgi:hypothetical protein